MKKILIWGTGKLAKKFIENGYHGEIIGFVETNKSADSYMGKPIYGSAQFPAEYDYIIVATSYATEIYNLAKKLNIDCSKRGSHIPFSPHREREAGVQCT